MARRPQPPEAVLARALRLVARQVALVEEGRRIELEPGRRNEANELFEVAALLRAERLEILVSAGLLESAEPWTR
jgi:hypothetical protein